MFLYYLQWVRRQLIGACSYVCSWTFPQTSVSNGSLALPSAGVTRLIYIIYCYYKQMHYQWKWLFIIRLKIKQTWIALIRRSCRLQDAGLGSQQRHWMTKEEYHTCSIFISESCKIVCTILRCYIRFSRWTFIFASNLGSIINDSFCGIYYIAF